MQLYLQYDQAKLRLNEANSFINDSNHGGPFDPSLAGIKAEATGVYFLVASNFNYVTVAKDKILLGTIEFKSISAGDATVKVANKLGLGGFDDGFASNCNLKEKFPTDAVVTIQQKGKSASVDKGKTTEKDGKKSSLPSTKKPVEDTSTKKK